VSRPKIFLMQFAWAGRAPLINQGAVANRAVRPFPLVVSARRLALLARIVKAHEPRVIKPSCPEFAVQRLD